MIFGGCELTFPVPGGFNFSPNSGDIYVGRVSKFSRQANGASAERLVRNPCVCALRKFGFVLVLSSSQSRNIKFYPQRFCFGYPSPVGLYIIICFAFHKLQSIIMRRQRKECL